MGSMTAVLQIRPRNPAAPFSLSLARRRSAAARRPVRARSLAMALAAGALVGGLISMSAASNGAADFGGAETKTEAVAP
jgi:ferric-dicitrate binding protein FerR (iron transport regulator)